jgi:hypothetical protein
MDERRAEEPGPDEAVFAPARIARRRTPILGLAVAAAIGIAGFALVGALDGAGDAATGDEKPPATRLIDVAAPREVPPSLPGQVAASGRLLDLRATASGDTVLVHGDVFTLDAAVIVVSIADAADEVLEVRSVDMPGGSTAFRIGANDRFLEAFEIEGWPAARAASVTADAYDSLGLIIASARTSVRPSADDQRSRAGAGR